MATVREIDKGYNNLRFNAKRLRNKEVLVGMFNDVHKEEGGNKKRITVAQLMAIHEYGSVSRGLPARPIFAITYNKNKGDMYHYVGVMLTNILAGKRTMERGLSKIGARYEGMLKETFTRGDVKPLSPAYKKRPSGQKVDSSSKPLIDTAQLKNSVSYKIV